METAIQQDLSPDGNLNIESLGEVSTSSQEYVQLQQRIFLTTFVVSAFLVLATAFFFDFQTSISVLIGAFSGILYLRLLARSIGKIGIKSKSVGKIQLLVPVVLVLAVSRLPGLDLLPALLGFLIYKPSLVIQALLES